MSNTIRAVQNRLFKTTLVVLDGEDNYYLDSGEEFIFGVKKYAYDQDYLFLKRIGRDDYDPDEGGYPILISTEEMNIEPGMYYYDVALERSSGQLEIIIGCTEFEILRSIVRSDST